ncbi:MAG: DUF3488 and transglutaminase-like domain-containing protein [Phycisphaerales bacterium]
MNVLALLRWGVLCAVLLSFFAFGIAEESPFAMFLLLVTGSAGWWFTERRPMKLAAKIGATQAASQIGWQGLPRWVTNIALAFVILMAVLRGTRGDSVISAFSAFLAAICVLKLWEKREPTDYGQLLTMSVFLVIGATLNSNSVGVGLVILLMVPVMVVTAFYYQMYLAKVDSGVLPALHGNVTSAMLAKKAKRALQGWSTLIVLLGFALATLVFVVTPRGLGSGELGEIGRLSLLRRTGFANQVNLNSGGLISQSQAIILSATFTDGRNNAMGSSEEPRYLRGAILDEYRSGRWTSGDPPLSASRAEFLNVGQILAFDETGDSTTQVMVINPRATPYQNEPLFHPLRATRLRLNGDGRVRRDPLTGAMIRDHAKGDWSYEVHWTQMPELTEDTRRGMVGFPSEVVQKEARKLLANSGIPAAPEERSIELDSVVARIFETHLRSKFQYSLNVPTPPSGVDPIAWFLENKPAAHCEFFASALAAMCRSVGIDARVVAGYMTTEFDEQQQSYIVRASNAHAWTEVNVAPGIWRVFDGTPVASAVFQTQRRMTLMGSLGAMMAGLDSLWNSKVVAYDDRSQRRVLGMEAANPQMPWLIDILQGFQGRHGIVMPRRSHGIGKPIAIGFGVVLIGAGIVVIAWSLMPKRRGRSLSGWGLQGDKDLQRVHSDVLNMLARVGVPKPDHVPVLQHVRVVAAEHPDMPTRDVAAALVPTCEVLYSQKFGDSFARTGTVNGLQSMHAVTAQAFSRWKRAKRG